MAILRGCRCAVAPILLILVFACAGVWSDSEFVDFLYGCADGDVPYVDTLLNAFPGWATRQDNEGESCLHAAAMTGKSKVTRAVLKAGGDPNARTAIANGRSMTPLSRTVYGGFVENARELLKGGADVNADFDKKGRPGEKDTVLDILHNNVLRQFEGGDRDMSQHPTYKKHYDMRDLLLQHGAKHFSEIDVDTVAEF